MTLEITLKLGPEEVEFYHIWRWGRCLGAQISAERTVLWWKTAQGRTEIRAREGGWTLATDGDMAEDVWRESSCMSDYKVLIL